MQRGPDARHPAVKLADAVTARRAEWARLARDRTWLGLWLALLVAPLLIRDVLPPDELRYLTVAWEMWTADDWLVPRLNGTPYADKPPLLFWLIQTGWAVLGVNAWWPRLLPAVASLAAIFLAQRLCRELWPRESEAIRIVPWLLLGTVAWTLYTQALMFDMLLVDWVLLAFLGLLRAEQGRPWGWRLLATATALGLLTKGPVMLLHLAGPGLLAPWWAREGFRYTAPPANRSLARWYGRFGLAVLAGGLVALGWALAAAHSGGAAYATNLLLGQTAGRVVDSFAHARPLWFYVVLLPVLLFPWAAWPMAWQSLWRTLSTGLHGRGHRFAAAATIPAFLGFSAISGKQPHYLLPLVPVLVTVVAVSLARASPARARAALPAAIAALGAALAALLPTSPAAGNLTVAPWSPAWGLLSAGLMPAFAIPGSCQAVVRRMALAVPAATLTFMAAFFAANGAAYDTRAAASLIHDLQAAGRPVAFAGKYEGEFHFVGRLTQPLEIIGESEGDLAAWSAAHPHGYVIRYSESRPVHGVHVQRLRGNWLSVQQAGTIANGAASRPEGVL